MELNLKRLKAERLASGISQDEMAKLMGWKTRTPYAKRENGYVDIGVNEFVKITDILGYGLGDLEIFFTHYVPDREQKVLE
ncbi:helix-turn-helix domain-containing protein [Mammaliicoccus sciuri]|uniref:helix-turn-helix domain-containing protein n=1 Tax=Mammaliicoccus sciuri TaxID=1296 RepID=UPI0034DD3D34